MIMIGGSKPWRLGAGTLVTEDGDRWRRISDAERRLLEAAPRLLEACRLSIADRQCSQVSDGPHPECPCWYCRTCAAIAKATGQERTT